MEQYFLKVVCLGVGVSLSCLTLEADTCFHGKAETSKLFIVVETVWYNYNGIVGGHLVISQHFIENGGS